MRRRPRNTRSRRRQLHSIKGSGWLRFSHYDQVIEAAKKSGGVAVGKWPRLSDHLREGTLVAPLDTAGTAKVGAFFVEILPKAQREQADVFVKWLRAEARRDALQLKQMSGLRPVARRQSGRAAPTLRIPRLATRRDAC